MSDKPNAMELLKEARGELAKAHDHLMELTAKLPIQYFGLVDGNIIQAEDCLISQLDTYLATPSESAMEILERVRLGGYALNANDPDDHGPNGDDYHFTLTDSDAAALIEDYGRSVPRAMLEEIIRAAAEVATDPIARALDECVNYQCIAAKYGYKVEG